MSREEHRWMCLERKRPFATVTCRCGWEHTTFGSRRAFKSWSMHYQAVTGAGQPIWSQAWFWTENWQRAEIEAEADIAAGRVHTFTDTAEMMRWLLDQDGEPASLYPPEDTR